MDDERIDWQALAKAAFEAPNIVIPGQPYESAPPYVRPIYTGIARAVVVALADQGLVVVQRDLLLAALDLFASDPEAMLARMDVLAAPDPAGGDESR